MPTRDMRAAGPVRNGVERAIASLARAQDTGEWMRFADNANPADSRGAEA